YALSEIVNPVTSCSSTLLQNVVVKYLNVSNDTLKAGEQVIFGYQIDTLYFAQETHTLTADLYPGQFIQFTFNDAIDLSNPDTLGITAYGIYPDDINASNDTLITEFIIKDSPVVNLGPDRTSHTGSITLDGGDGTGYTYLWNDNSTNRYLIAENTDTYWVTTTAPNGCQDQDTVNLIILKPDYRISAILTPGDACQLSSSETVQVEIENLGTDTLQVGQSIFVTYGVNGQLQQTQTVTMTSKFTPGNILIHNFTKTFDFSTPNAYLINAYTTYADDINPSNNASSKTVTVWGPPAIDLGPDTAICQGNTLILDAGAGHSSYLWSTEATTQTIVINTSGEYWVEVADSHGCLNRDTINVLVNNLPTVTHDPLDAVCLDEPAFTLTGGNPTGGEYSGAGTNVTTFNASEAGDGTHTLTYTYTDINGCSNSTTVDITVHPLPVVDLGENRSTTVPLTLDAGGGFASYLWQDNSTAQTYVVNETGLYSVTVTDNNGCQAHDSVYITYLETLDVIVSELLSPTDKCYDSQSESVTVTLLNRGTKTFTSGENIEISYAIGASNPVKEQYTFTSNFAQNDTVHFTFSNPIALSTGSFNFTCFTTLAGDNGDSTHFTMDVWELPNLEFGSDTIRHSLPYELTSGISGVTYLWSTGATSPTITISNGAWGKYWLTVTDTHGCVSSDTVVIWWPVSAGIIAETPFKISIYPNPAKDEIYVEIEGDKVSDYSIAIISPAGFTVLETKVEQTNRFTQKFEVNKLQAGMYFVRISNSLGNTSILKVIIGS
ncbi:MAG TPA: hypothetical protein DDY04_07130, partial [Bacteroidales bacterium]|nr:hypothetical protein [Bacteroidales bacterium]